MKTTLFVGALLIAGAAMAQSTTPPAVRDAKPPLPTDSRPPFDGLDRNGDGRLSAAESAAGAQSFGAADKDHNGSLDRSEYSDLRRNMDSATARPPSSAPATATPRTEYPAIQGSGSSSSVSSVPPIRPVPETSSVPGTLPPAHGSAPPAAVLDPGPAPSPPLPPAAPETPAAPR